MCFIINNQSLYIYICTWRPAAGCRQAEEETSMWELGPPRDESEELLQLVGSECNYWIVPPTVQGERMCSARALAHSTFLMIHVSA